MKKTFVLSILLLVLACLPNRALGENMTDSQHVDTVMLQEVSVSAVKNGLKLRSQAQASTRIGRQELENLNVVTIKGISDVVPNFFIPDYGSRITSSIYVRGIGARMDQPAVGMNVDNVPILNKDAYDFDIADIKSVDMIRGPQSILYGRNTMGGVINIYTLSPLDYQGWRIMAEGGNGAYWKANAGWYGRIKDRTGLSFSGGYTASGGFFTNEYTDRKLDHEKQWSARTRFDHRFSHAVKLQNVFNISNLRQGGYAYEYTGTGRIEYNDTCFYRRLWLSDGLTVNWQAPGFTLTSISSVQHIDDNMTLDQDFLPVDYFTLTQKKKETSVTEDIVARGILDNWEWLGGLFAFYKDMDMQAPVTFHDYGIRSLIEDHRNEVTPDYPIAWATRDFVLNSDFSVATHGVALYHRSQWSPASHWHLTGGLRLDYEGATLDYHSYCSTAYDIFHPYPEIFRRVPVEIDDTGRLTKHFVELLPSLSVLYDLPMPASNVYANFSKGYKAGGFNTQMFSDVLQQRLMNIMGIGAKYDVSDIVEYKPEKSWNYEVGTHLTFAGGKVKADVAAFYIDCRDQQLTMFPDGTTTGRIMTNAGKTRSFGGEVQLFWKASPRLALNGSYGYTNAKFRKFWNGREDFAGKHVPYAPMNTLFLQTVWQQPVKTSWLETIVLEANFRGVGKIYWNESNTQVQPFYGLLGASATFGGKHYELQLWGRNLTSTNYHTFYFVSIGNEFVQHGRPLQFGITLRLTFDS